jgi:hypothetical protein
MGPWVQFPALEREKGEKGRGGEERGEKKCTVNKNSGLFANEDGLQSLKRTIYS